MSTRFLPDRLALALGLALLPAFPAGAQEDVSQPYFRFSFGTLSKALGVPAAQSNTDSQTGLTIQVPCISCTGRTGARMTFEPLVSNVPEGNYVIWYLASGRIPEGMDLDTQTGLVSGIVGFTEPTTFQLGVVDNRLIPVTSPPITFKVLDGVRVAYQGSTGKLSRPIDLAPTTRFVFGAPVFTLYQGSLPRGAQLDRNSGRIAGQVTNSVIGTQVRVTDSDGATGVSAPFDIMTDAPELIFPSTAYDVRTDVPVSTKPTLINFVPPTDAQSTGGALPPGLRVEPTTGYVSGVPTQPGTYGGIVVTVTDAAGASKSSPPLTYVVTKPSLSYASGSGRVDRNYSAKPTMTGLAAPGYYLSAGTLPPGVAVNAATGEVQGIPTAAGTYAGVVVLATDGAGAHASSDPFTVTVLERPTATASSVAKRVNQPVSMQATSKDFPSAPTWKLGGGTLPAGLTLNAATGLISGSLATPYAADALYLIATSGDLIAETAPFSIRIANPLASTPVTTPLHAGMTATAQMIVTNTLGAPAAIAFAQRGATPPTWFTRSGMEMAYAPPANVANGTYSFLYTATDIDGASVPVSMYAVTNGALAMSPQPATTYFTVGQNTSQSLYGWSNGIGAVTGELLQGGSPAPNALAPCAGLSLAPSTGVLTVKPTVECSVGDLSVRGTDTAGGVVESSRFAISVEATLTALPPSPLKFPTGTAVSLPVYAYGGMKPYTFTQTKGSVPTGLRFDAPTGTFLGTPTQAGTYSGQSVTVRDARNRTVTTGDFPFTVVQQLSVNQPTPAGAIEAGKTGYLTMNYTGGTSPYTFKLVEGTFPPGVSLRNWFIDYPSTLPAGTAARGLVVEMTDSSGQKDRTDPFDMVWVAPLAAPTSTDSKAGNLGQDFRMAWTTSGGVPPYKYGWTADAATAAAKAGFGLSPDGVITGRSDTVTNANVQLYVTDSRNVSAFSPSFTVSIAGPVTATLPQYVPTVYPDAGYYTFPKPTGGSGSYSWALAPGYSLPNNRYTLSPGGQLSWQQYAPTTFKAAFVVTDSAGRATTTPVGEFVAATKLTHAWPRQTKATGSQPFGGSLTSGGLETTHDLIRYRQQSNSANKDTTVSVGLSGGRPPYTVKITDRNNSGIVTNIDNATGKVTMKPIPVGKLQYPVTFDLSVTDTSGQTITSSNSYIQWANPTITNCEYSYKIYAQALNSCVYNIVNVQDGARNLDQEGKYALSQSGWQWSYSNAPPGIQVIDAGRENGSATICGSTPLSSKGLWHTQVSAADLNGSKTQTCTVHITVVGPFDP